MRLTCAQSYVVVDFDLIQKTTTAITTVIITDVCPTQSKNHMYRHWSCAHDVTHIDVFTNIYAINNPHSRHVRHV